MTWQVAPDVFSPIISRTKISDIISINEKLKVSLHRGGLKPDQRQKLYDTLAVAIYNEIHKGLV